MVKYGMSGRPRMFNTKEHCGMFCMAVARNNMWVVMDRIHMRTSESTVLNPFNVCLLLQPQSQFVVPKRH